MEELTNFPLIVVAGPTGSGKSDLALSLAKTFRGELVNYDSVQVYRGLDIGSAKTLFADRDNIPHHLYDILEPTADLTAGAYGRLSRATLRDIAARQKLPILVGGTGFYLRSLLDGLSLAPGRNPDLRRRLVLLSGKRPAALHRFLRQADPAASRRIHPNDHQKLIRAIELAASAIPMPPRQPLTGFRIVKFGLNPTRVDLYMSLDKRCARMFENGLLEETRALLDSGVPANAKSLQTLGYKQAVSVIEKRLTPAEAVQDLQIKTRRYAKRQITWFRREQNIHWLPGFGHQPEIQNTAHAYISAFLTESNGQSK